MSWGTSKLFFLIQYRRKLVTAKFPLRIFGKKMWHFYFNSGSFWVFLLSSSDVSVTRLTFNGLGLFFFKSIHFLFTSVFGKLYINPIPLNYVGCGFFSMSEISLFSHLQSPCSFLKTTLLFKNSCSTQGMWSELSSDKQAYWTQVLWDYQDDRKGSVNTWTTEQERAGE